MDRAADRLKWKCRGAARAGHRPDDISQKHPGRTRLSAARLPDNDLWDIVSGRSEQYETRISKSWRASRRLGKTMDKKRHPQAARRQDARIPGALRDHRPDVDRHPHAVRQVGMFTYDPGFLSTASCSSTITYIDGDAGVLLYRGYPIEQLAQHCDFLEVCYLLLNGELPNRKQKDEFVDIVTHHTMVHEQLARLYQGFRRDAHPMAVMVGVVGALSAFYHDALDINNPQHRIISAFRLVAKMPTIVAMSYKYSIGQPFMYPKNNLSYTANFMRMMFGVPTEEYKVERRAGARDGPHLHPARRPRAERLDLDGAAVGLLGRQPVRLHRRRHRLPVGPGARRRERGLPRDARGDRRRLQGAEFIKKVKDKNSGVRLMGFGHRVYKNHDPRAKLMRETCHEVLNELGLHNDRLFKLAMALEKIALED
jgi:citrate synthase